MRGVIRLVKKYEAKTRPVPVRFYEGNDDFIHEWMREHSLNNRNQAINDIVDYAKNLWYERKKTVEKYVSELKMHRITVDDIRRNW